MSTRDPRGPNVLATMVTTTSYGTWLPGDLRGYVDNGQILPGDPQLLDRSRALLSKAPVLFTDVQQIVLQVALKAACAEFHYTLHDLSIESWHLHWVVTHGFDRVDVMVGRLKTRMRQMVSPRGAGRVWTEGFCHRCLYVPAEMVTASTYIARHDGCRLTAGRWIERRAR